MIDVLGNILAVIGGISAGVTAGMVVLIWYRHEIERRKARARKAAEQAAQLARRAQPDPDWDAFIESNGLSELDRIEKNP
ncbi:hypothetical protein [Nonomuraea basaltis]|uniref:hypothetical protein n=1 Tax=Nonomuraea basaltis TaxID=2495887 RepID=UPI00110C6A46|nr:hypothetical protein [Nonomuraea basaltis]TMR91280.1 hypothetical protein EJK15_50710 [Nonomuraea basaltis]